MTNRLANIAMDAGAFIQEHASAEVTIVAAATAFLDNEVDHWPEVSQTEYHEPQVGEGEVYISMRTTHYILSTIRELL